MYYHKLKTFLIPTIIFIITFFVYFFSHRGEGVHWNYFVLLADTFLHGRLNVLDHPVWLNELVFWQGKYYVVYPPMPAIILMPFVAIFGKTFPQPLVSILLGAVNASLSYAVFIKIFQRRLVALWTTILYAFGTIQWYHAEVGSAWYSAHIVALFFLWIILWEAFTSKRLFLIGLLIGFAYLARLPAILSIVFILSYLHRKFIDFDKKRINFGNLALLVLGLLPSLLFNFLYNYLRFGVIYDIAYSLLPIFNEPWYKYGLFNIHYIPTHFWEISTALPKFIPEFPFVIPNLNVMALWFVTPAFILILFAKLKSKLVISSFLTVLIMVLPSLTHGSNGFTQFGYRFALDFMPFLLLLTACGMRDHIKWWMKMLIILSIVINLWGVVMISFLNIWIM